MQSHAISRRLRERVDKIAARHGAATKVVEVPPGPPVLSTLVAEVYGLRIGTTSIVLGAPASSRPGGRSPPEDAKRPCVGCAHGAGWKPALPALSEGAGDRLRPRRSTPTC